MPAHMNVNNSLFYPVRLLVLPVNGTTVTITKSAVELDEDPLLAPINPIVVVWGNFQSALSMLLLPI